MTWDSEALSAMFGSRDKELILKIPLSKRRLDDKWMWVRDDKGLYTVKSGYLQLMTLSSSNPSSSDLVPWQSIWSLKVPAKVKNFIWRVCVNVLPTMKSLKAKRVNVTDICPVCAGAVEDPFHALVTCPFASRIWMASAVGLSLSNVSSFVDWWSHLVKNVNKCLLDTAAMLCWSIWLNRNSLVWNRRRSVDSQVLTTSASLLHQWQAAQVSSPDPCSSNGIAVTKWQRPPFNLVKCNFDAALFTHSQKLGMGCVVRSASGEFIAAKSLSFDGPLTPLIAEALTCREALSWLKGKGYGGIVFESDSQLLVQALQRPQDQDSSYFGLIVGDCKVLSLDYDVCRFNFVKRSANQVAHVLARAADSLSDLEAWSSSPPLLIQDVMLHDLS